MAKQLNRITLTHPASGETLEGLLFPGFGNSGSSQTQSPSLPGNSTLAARFNHGHYTAEIPVKSDDDTNLYISRALLTKLDENVYTKTETEKLISDMITGISWAGTVNTFNDLPKAPYTGLSDGTVYAVLTKTTVGDEEKPSGTYRLHIESEHPIGKADGWYLVSLDTTQLATSTNPGSISADWYTKLKTILDTGFTGIIASGGENGTSTTAARSNHLHDSRYIRNSSGLASGEQTIGTTLVVPVLKHATIGNMVYTETNGMYVGNGNVGLKLMRSSSFNNGNIVSVKQLQSGASIGYLWDTHNLSEEVVNFCKNLQQNPDSIFPGYGGSGNDWGTAKTVARSDHKHSNYVVGTYNATAHFGGPGYISENLSYGVSSNSPVQLSLNGLAKNPVLRFTIDYNSNYGEISYSKDASRFEFSKKIFSSSGFVGNLTGNADTATKATSATNADTVDNCHVISDAAIPEANKIPKYNANGYLYASYMNIKNGVESSISATNIIVENGDGFLRKTTASNFRAKVTDPYYFRTGVSGTVADSALDTWASRKSGYYTVSHSGATQALVVFSGQGGSTSGCELYFDYQQTFLKFRTTIDNNRYNPWTNIWTSKSLTKLSQLTNDSGFITSSALSSYLPLSGGTMTGNINMNSKIISSVAEITFSSDIRLKTDLVKWNDAKDRKKDIRNIDATFFKFKKSNDSQCGYIAQEVLKLFPEYVHEREDGFYAVDYNSIFTAKIALLEKENETLKSELSELKEMINNLVTKN